MALPSSFLDELRSRTPLASVIGRRVRLARSGRQWKGCCPFHGEKSPSFYVYEDHYHCFGCGAHGDVIGFVMQSQGLAFMEAITELAAEAGLHVPKPTAEAAAAEKRRLDIGTVLELACVHYQRRLGLPEGQAARDYLLGRGLTSETISRFALGWAGDRGALTSELMREGVTTEYLTESGLIRREEETGRTYELFSQRVMFPIRDRRGALISFGGRIMGQGQPKYVNGPDTAVFLKRRNLYGMNLAREAVRNGGALIVVEGYMDVIATSQAGFGGTVAPLGTALTSEQLEMLWQVSPAPVLCFDGDAAGARAASRAMELALPMLTAERSLRFATLATGEDPDSLVRQRGPAAFQDVLEKARSPADILFDMVREQTGDRTPEQRAALKSRLVEATARIAEKTLAAEYREEHRQIFKKRYREGFRGHFNDRLPASRNRLPGVQWANGAMGAGPRSPRPVPHQDATFAERIRILTAIVLRHPFLLRDVPGAFARLSMPPELARLRAAIEAWTDTAEALDSTGLINHLTDSGFHMSVEQVLAGAPMPLPACASAQAMPAEAEAGWWEFLGYLNVANLQEELVQAEAEAAFNLTDKTQQRLVALRQALIRIRTGEADSVEPLDARQN